MNRNQWQGATVLILGSGPSVNDMNVNDLQRFPTIGANQISRRIDPDIVTLFDTVEFMGEGVPFAWRSLKKSVTLTTKLNRAGWEKSLPQGHEIKELHSIKDWNPAEEWVGFDYMDYKRAVDDWPDEGPPEYLPYGPTSIGASCWLAAYLGAARVGLIGVDLGDDYFFESAKPFATKPEVKRQAQVLWGKCVDMVRDITGTEVFNLSQRSLIDTIPKANLVEWLMEMDK